MISEWYFFPQGTEAAQGCDRIARWSSRERKPIWSQTFVLARKFWGGAKLGARNGRVRWRTAHARRCGTCCLAKTCSSQEAESRERATGLKIRVITENKQQVNVVQVTAFRPYWVGALVCIYLRTAVKCMWTHFNRCCFFIRGTG